MYDNEMVPPAEHSHLTIQTVDPSVFSDFVLPGPPVAVGKNSQAEISPTQPARQAALRDTQSPDDGSKVIPKGKVEKTSPVEPKAPDWYDLHQGAPKIVPKPENNTPMPTVQGRGESNEVRPLRELSSDSRDYENLLPGVKTGEAAVRAYVGDIAKLVQVAWRDRDTDFELRSALKDSSLTVAETFSQGPIYSSTVHRIMVFRQKDANWELHVNSDTGGTTAMRLNERTKQMESTPAGPLLEHVSLTMRAAMAVRCFRDGDVDEGRAQLKSLLEDGQKLDSGERLKKIINTEADLLYKPARLRAVTRDDFNKILTETERNVSQTKKKR